MDPFLDPLLLLIFPSIDTSLDIASKSICFTVGLAGSELIFSSISISVDISANEGNVRFGESYDTSDRSDLDLKELNVEFPKISFLGLFKLLIISLINIFISLDILFNFNNESRNIFVSYVLSSFFNESIILSLSNSLIIIDSSKFVILISNPILGITYLFPSNR